MTAPPPDGAAAATDPRRDRRWQALRARAADGAEPFVYAVITTGIFCRPGCPSRRPKRANVRFFDAPADARAAGFRPCKRCRPAEPPAAAGAVRHPRLDAVRRACALIEQADSPPRLPTLAAAVALSPTRLQRAFGEVLGLSPKAYADAIRRRRLNGRLAAGDSVTEAIFASGFNSPSRFYDRARQLLGMDAGRYRRGAPGERIRHVCVDTSLGRLLVAATARGLCMIEFGASDAALTAALDARFPHAERVAGDAEFAAWVAAAVAHIETPAEAAPLPLDLRGTAFQQRVWQALTEVPAGRTLSYGELAAAAGRPKAVRAAASACAANPVAVVVPCHRAVRAGGDPGGYRWGPERKRALLEREGDARMSGGDAGDETS